MNPVFIVSLSYFLIGAVAILGINKRKPEGSKTLWTKYLVYFLIVHGLLFSFQVRGLFAFIAFAIILKGGAELSMVYQRKKELKAFFVRYFLSYAFVCLFFMLFASSSSPKLLTQTYLLVFCFDGFSQICGQLLGKTPFTQISPNKTLEGTIGGAVITLLTYHLLWPYTNLQEFVIAFTILVVSLVGDLSASYYKRRFEVKDFAQFIPGHGGILDRFDSLIPAGALVGLLQLFLR